MREPLELRQDEAIQRYPYPYFVDYFKEWFLSNPAFGATRAERFQLLFTGGLRITTTLDPGIQHAAEDAVTSVLSYPSDPDAAVTVLDPRTGEVRAMVGGKEADYWNDRRAGRVNLATGTGGTGRQTGSAFKPFALVAALENGYSPEHDLRGSRVDLDPDGRRRVLERRQRRGRRVRRDDARAATIDSVNTVYAQLIQRLTPETVVEVADRMGMRCCGHVSAPDDAAAAVPLRGAGGERGEHARDGERLRHARDGGSARRPGPGDQRHRCRPVRCSGNPPPTRTRWSIRRSPRWPTGSSRRPCSTGRAPPRTSGGRRSARPEPTTTTTTPGSSAPCRS